MSTLATAKHPMSATPPSSKSMARPSASRYRSCRYIGCPPSTPNNGISRLGQLVKAIVVFVALFTFPALAHAAVVTCAGVDDTAAIQTAIDETSFVHLEGTCKVSSINATGKTGLVIEGDGSFATEIAPLTNGANVIDLTGSSNATLRDFHLCGTCAPGIVPATGILSAQISGSYTSDVLHIESVRVDGSFSLAAWYNLAVASAHVAFSQFYNYQPNAITVVFTGNNFFGAASSFVAIDNSNSHVPSDWTLVGVEIHNFGSGWALWIGGAGSVNFFGGNMSSSHAIVSLNPVVISGVTTYPAHLQFNGITFYSDFAPAAACAVSGYTAAASFVNVTATVPLTGC